MSYDDELAVVGYRALAVLRPVPGLTERQRRILVALHRYHSAHGYWPSIQDLMTETATNSTSTIVYNLDMLRDRDLLSHEAPVQYTTRQPRCWTINYDRLTFATAEGRCEPYVWRRTPALAKAGSASEALARERMQRRGRKTGQP